MMAAFEIWNFCWHNWKAESKSSMCGSTEMNHVKVERMCWGCPIVCKSHSKKSMIFVTHQKCVQKWHSNEEWWFLVQHFWGVPALTKDNCEISRWLWSCEEKTQWKLNFWTKWADKWQHFWFPLNTFPHWSFVQANCHFTHKSERLCLCVNQGAALRQQTTLFGFTLRLLTVKRAIGNNVLVASTTTKNIFLVCICAAHNFDQAVAHFWVFLCGFCMVWHKQLHSFSRHTCFHFHIVVFGLKLLLPHNSFVAFMETPLCIWKCLRGCCVHVSTHSQLHFEKETCRKRNWMQPKSFCANNLWHFNSLSFQNGVKFCNCLWPEWDKWLSIAGDKSHRQLGSVHALMIKHCHLGSPKHFCHWHKWVLQFSMTEDQMVTLNGAWQPKSEIEMLTDFLVHKFPVCLFMWHRSFANTVRKLLACKSNSFVKPTILTFPQWEQHVSRACPVEWWCISIGVNELSKQVSGDWQSQLH